jgi:DNA polymerase-1
MPKKLFLIDGSALYYRSYFAFIRNPLINSKGENTSSTFGFLNSMIKIIEDEAPDYLAVIFDTKEPTFRHEIYPEYKANREKMPEEMADQYPRMINTLKSFNFLLLDKAGFEADDIIGTLADKYASADIDVFIVSGDKDMAQLVNDHVFLYSQAKSKQKAQVIDAKLVKEKYGIKPNQVIDWLTLMGDTSDNIPGVPKVGGVTASKLLNSYGSLDGVYDHIYFLKKSTVRDNLIKFKEQTKLAKSLTTIDKQVPLEIQLTDLEFKIWDMEKVNPILDELEFRNLFNRIQSLAKSGGSSQAFAKHDQVDVNYMLIESDEQFGSFLEKLVRQPEFVFDLETSSLNVFEAEIAGIAIAWQKNEAFYLPLNHPDVTLNSEKVLSRLKPVFEDDKIKKIGQNIKFDAMILKQHGIPVKGIYFDTMIASYLINPSGQHKLDRLSEQYLGYEMIHIEELIGSGKKQKLMTDLPAQQVYKYAAEDADITFKLYNLFKPEITGYNMDELFYQLEMPLVETLMSMEAYGVKLDVELLKKLSQELSISVDKLEKEVYREAGAEFNLNSAQQLGLIMFDKLEIHKTLGLRKPPKTKTGQYSTSEKIMERYAKHPIIANIMNYRKLTKLKNTYLDALPELVNQRTGRVHTSFNQAVTATGRLSSSNPNLQNIPVRTEIGREIRKAFIAPDKNYSILSADYSQIELRIMAHLSEDETMIESFKNNMDIHASTASLIFNIPIDEVTSDHRRKAKEVNFGIIYGMSRYGLAGRLGISNEEAEEFIIDYMATYPKIQVFMRNSIKRAVEQGYVETMMRRRRYLPEIKSGVRQVREFGERTAINTPIQGSAADLIKKAMIEIHHFIEDEKIPAKMLLQVHDELVFEVENSIADEFSGQVKQIMENAMELNVPIIVDSGLGANWLEAHQ